MRALVCIAALLASVGPVLAQDAPAVKKKPAPKSAASAKAKPAAAKPADVSALKESYAAMPLADRLSIQSDLVWSGDYNGGVTGEFSDRSIAAVKTFQKRNGGKETGILTPQERETLAAAVKGQREQVGWRLVEDDVIPGARLGIPAKFAVKSERGATGTRWFSARGEIQIETFREKMGGAQLSTLFEEMKKSPPSRRVEYNTINTDFFVLSGLQGLKKFYVRVQLKDNEARGMTILYDQAMDGIMEPVVVAMSSAFAPFGNGAIAATPQRRVEYASGIIVSRAGHVVTERQATDGCHVIIVAGRGNAERIADDKTSDLALLRIHGASHGKPLSLSAGPPKSPDLTLVGIADPQVQNGGDRISTASAKLRGVDGARVLLDATPAPGFAGAAALDGQGQFVGMLDMNAMAGASAPQAALIPAATIRKFLDAAQVAPESGPADLDTAKAAVTRVICIRK